MSIDFLKRTVLLVVFVLAQALVLGRIHLFHYATPLLYVYFVTLFPRNYPKWGVLTWAFVMGLTVDMFFNTPGVAAASLTAVAAIQPYFYALFVPRDAAENLEPSLLNLGPTKYSYYIVTLVTVYCLLFFTLELFSFDNLFEWLMCVVGSTLITLLLIFTFEIAKRRV
jgi:rod shape-determining protein MreD